MNALLGAVLILAAVTGPRLSCLGPFCVAPDNWHKRALVSNYGPGTPQDDGGRLCYTDRGLFISFTFGRYDQRDPLVEGVSVGVRPSPFCTASSPSRVHFPALRTREGIEVGSSAEQAMRAYSKQPRYRVRDYANGARSISWSVCPDCNVLAADLTIERGKVVEISFDSVP